MLLAVLAVACGPKPVPLTAELRDAHGLDEAELRRLQLYVSHDVTLRREEQRLDRRIDGGALRLRAGKVVDEIVVRRKTPCVATEVSLDGITVALEDGSTLRFELAGTSSGSLGREPWPIEPGSGLGSFATPPGSGRLRLDPLATSFGGAYVLALRDGRIVHRGVEWQAVGESARAQLLVDTEELTDSVERRTVVGGRRL
jgi:hypothetical protein